MQNKKIPVILISILGYIMHVTNNKNYANNSSVDRPAQAKAFAITSQIFTHLLL